jgi:hypothetical protein
LKKVIKVVALALMVASIFSFSIQKSLAATKVSYLMNSNDNYTYTYYDTSSHKATFSETDTFQGHEKCGDLWSHTAGLTCWKETSAGLFASDEGPSAFYEVLPYPIKLGKKWKGSDGSTIAIVGENKTVKTPAGTFKNVVVVQSGSEKSYYAAGYGCIRIDSKGAMEYQLTKLVQTTAKGKLSDEHT